MKIKIPRQASGLSIISSAREKTSKKKESASTNLGVSTSFREIVPKPEEVSLVEKQKTLDVN